MAGKSKYPTTIDYDNQRLARSLTDKPPAHFTLKIDSFSLLYKMMVVHAQAQSYESEVFEAGGYKWKLSLYPNGEKGKDAEGYISLYLVIVDTHDFPQGWKVNANFKFFMYDNLQNKYLTLQDANSKPSEFNAEKTGYGISRVLPLCSFLHSGNGYLAKDKCVFGAEVLVKNYIGTDCTVESLALVKDSYTWKIDKFSSISKELLISDAFTIGNWSWKLWLYPKGDSRAKKNTLSVFLQAEDFDFKKKKSEQKAFGKVEFRIVNQCGGKDFRVHSIGWCFSNASSTMGYSAFLPLADLHDASKGFLLNDTLILKARVSVFSTERSISKTIYLPDPNAKQFQQTYNVKDQGKSTTGCETPKGIQPRKRSSWFKRWFF